MSQTEVQLIKADAVQTADIANSAVTDAKISALTSSKLTGALPAISGASLTNLPASGKAHNLVINGAMLVAQRGTSSTTNGYGSVDRFQVNYDSGLTEAPTQEQLTLSSSDTPYASGFRKAFRITNGNQTSQDANDYIQLVQKLEAQDLATSGWDYTSSSSYITLQFWVKASIAQTFYVKIQANDNARSFTFPINVTTSWQKLTKTISGDSNLVFNNDTGTGMEIRFIPYYGTSYTDSGHTINTWIVSTGSNQTPDNANTWFSGNDATFDVTGVQLEVGDSATDFEHLSFQEDYLRCARYYIQMNRLPVMSNRLAGYCSCTTRFNPVPMRAIPSVSLAGTLSFNSFFYGAATPTTTNTPGFQNNGDSGQPYGGDNMILNFSGFSTSGFQTNEFGEVYGTTIRISAEL